MVFVVTVAVHSVAPRLRMSYHVVASHGDYLVTAMVVRVSDFPLSPVARVSSLNWAPPPLSYDGHWVITTTRDDVVRHPKAWRD